MRIKAIDNYYWTRELLEGCSLKYFDIDQFAAESFIATSEESLGRLTTYSKCDQLKIFLDTWIQDE